MYYVGQALLGELEFADGEKPAYKRPYLIVDVDNINMRIKILNVSSKKGKEHKLKFGTNYDIKNYNPPFKYPTFAKLDSLREITFVDASNMVILDKGKILDGMEISIIKSKLKYIINKKS